MIRTLSLTTVLLAGLATTASAHFKLNEPVSTIAQSALGDPQKTGPCGGAGTATNAVANYLPGSTITIKLAETISHPGHYRVALAQDEASLPADPPVTAGATQCGSAPINPAPTLPVLADGLFTNLVPADGEQMVQISLPAGMTCTNCVLQVIEFMSNHAAPCFYYHCARVNISDTPLVDGPPNSGPDAGGTMPDAGGGNSSSGGCSTSGGSAAALVGLALLGLVFRRRK